MTTSLLQRPGPRTGIQYPTALCELSIRLIDFKGNPAPDENLKPIRFSPIEFVVKRNSYYEADTAEITADLESFPLDPRIIRGATVTIWLADAKSLDPQFWRKQSIDAMGKFALFLGVVDEVETTIDSDWRKVRLRCRDYTAYFLDVDAFTNPIEWHTKTLRTIIEDILKIRIETRAIEIHPDDIAATELIQPRKYKLNADDPKLGCRHKQKGERYWDVLQEICLEAGFIIYPELDKLRVRIPDTIFFDDERVLNLDKANRWVLGRNLYSFTGKRNMGRQHGINVSVTSYDPKTKRTLVAKCPPEESLEGQRTLTDATTISQAPGKARTNKEDIYRNFVVRNITRQSQMEKIAKQLFTLLREHEFEGEFETFDMVDSDGAPVQKLAYGDPIVIDIAQDWRSLLALDRAEQLRRLLELGYGQETADQLTQALHAPRIPYYLHSAAHHFDSSEGYRLVVQLHSRKEIDLNKPLTAK